MKKVEGTFIQEADYALPTRPYNSPVLGLRK